MKTQDSRKEVEKIDNKENLIRLIEQYQKLIFSICIKMTGDYFAAEDITQETFLAAYRSWDRFDGAHEKAWLCRIAANRCTDYLKSASRRSVPTEEKDLPEETGHTDDPLQLYMSREIMRQLKNACEELSDPYKETALHYFVDGMTAKEIADSGGIKRKTVETQIYRAREMLRKKLRKEDLLS